MGTLRHTKTAKPMDVRCPYCGRPAELVDSAEVYGGRSYGMIWVCRPCDAYVGCHKNSPRYAPLGRLANAELREWKQRAHAVFDPLWQRKMQRDKCSKSAARSAGYQWLAGRLGIEVKDCHIGMFDVDICRRVVEACTEVTGCRDSTRDTTAGLSCYGVH